jgi:hypothetical protein
MVPILLFLILCALSPRLARLFGCVVIVPIALLFALLLLASWPHH